VFDFADSFGALSEKAFFIRERVFLAIEFDRGLFPV